MVDPKPPGSYRFGEGASAHAVVPGRICAWLARHTNLNEVRISARGTDAELYAVLFDVHRAGLEWVASATGSEPRKEPEAATSSEWINTATAAALLGITDRAVRLAIREGRLSAEQIDGKWRITRQDFQHYKAARAA